MGNRRRREVGRRRHRNQRHLFPGRIQREQGRDEGVPLQRSPLDRAFPKDDGHRAPKILSAPRPVRIFGLSAWIQAQRKLYFEGMVEVLVIFGLVGWLFLTFLESLSRLPFFPAVIAAAVLCPVLSRWEYSKLSEAWRLRGI